MVSQSVVGYCLVVCGGSGKTAMMRVTKSCAEGAGKDTGSLFDDSSVFSLCQVLTFRQLLSLQATLRKYTHLIYNIYNSRRRFDRLCKNESWWTVTASCHYTYRYLSSKVYNKINKNMNMVYTLPWNECNNLGINTQYFLFRLWDPMWKLL